MFKYKKYYILAISIFLFTGCLSSNEDPTNIELEVLRASLLEKQLTIDDLQQSIDEHVQKTNQYVKDIQDLEEQLNTEIAIRERFIEESNHLLPIHINKKNYYEIDKDMVFMIHYYEDIENQYGVERLYIYKNGSLPQLRSTGKNISFDVLRKKKQILILSNQDLVFQNYDGTIEQTLPLTEHNTSGILSFTEDGYIYEDNPLLKNYIEVTRFETKNGEEINLNTEPSEEAIQVLLGVYSVDYTNLNKVNVNFHAIESNQYIIDLANEFVFYVEENKGEAAHLYRYNLKTKKHKIIAKNTEANFNLYKKENKVYYYNEATKTDEVIDVIK